jgi:hypothetical protein
MMAQPMFEPVLLFLNLSKFVQFLSGDFHPRAVLGANHL